eukprot:jgi/Psemu1/25648/gm1.25648_g
MSLSVKLIAIPLHYPSLLNHQSGTRFLHFLEDLIKKGPLCPELTREALFALNRTGELTVKIPNNPKYSNGLPLILCTLPQSGTIVSRNLVPSPLMRMSEHFHDFPSEYTRSLAEYSTVPHQNPDNPLPDYTCFLPEYSIVTHSGTFPIALETTCIAGKNTVGETKSVIGTQATLVGKTLSPLRAQATSSQKTPSELVKTQSTMTSTAGMKCVIDLTSSNLEAKTARKSKA